MVTINQLISLVSEHAKKKVQVKHIDGPLGVRGRNSDNKLFRQKIGWEPNYPLSKGMEKTYEWIKSQIEKI